VFQGSKYVGPISQPGAKNETVTTRKLLRRQGNITVASGGIILAHFSTTPSLADGWSELASSFSEFRTLGIRLDYYARNRYVANGIPIYIFVDRRNATTDPVNVSEAMQHESLSMGDTNDHWSKEWRMDGEEESQFIPTDNPTSLVPGAIKFACTSGVLTTGAVIGEYLQTYLVEFRGSS